MERHVKILAVLHIIYGLYILIALSVVSLILGVVHALGAPIFSPFTTIHWLGGNVIISAIPFWVAAYLAPMVVAIPGILGGIGLLNRQHWARIAVMVVGILYLLDIPFGTALGAYTLWVVAQPETRRLLAA